MKVKEVEFDSFAERWSVPSGARISGITGEAKCLKNNFNKLREYVDRHEDGVFEYKIYSKDTITINDYLYFFCVSTNYD